MLRGVNKQIIEINSTDNGYFEKAILFVRPEYAGTDNQKLTTHANNFIKEIEVNKKILSEKNFKNAKIKLALSVAFSVLLAGALTFMLIKIL